MIFLHLLVVGWTALCRASQPSRAMYHFMLCSSLVRSECESPPDNFFGNLPSTSIFPRAYLLNLARNPAALNAIRDEYERNKQYLAPNFVDPPIYTGSRYTILKAQPPPPVPPAESCNMVAPGTDEPKKIRAFLDINEHILSVPFELLQSADMFLFAINDLRLVLEENGFKIDLSKDYRAQRTFLVTRLFLQQLSVHLESLLHNLGQNPDDIFYQYKNSCPFKMGKAFISLFQDYRPFQNRLHFMNWFIPFFRALLMEHKKDISAELIKWLYDSQVIDYH